LVRRYRRLNLIFWTGLGLAGVGLSWSFFPVPDADPNYFPIVRRSVYGRRGPRVLIDESHWNLHKANGRYRPFAQLVARDGYRVSRNKQKLVPPLLTGTDVLVIAGALGFKGSLQRFANLAGLAGKVDFEVNAFESDEIQAVRDWVLGGGSLLLVVDDAPCDEAAREMAAAFEVRMTDWYTEDPNPMIRFEPGAGIEDHPITQGRPDFNEQIGSVLTFAGQSLTGPSGSDAILKLSSKAIAIAFEFGKGRVVAIGSAAALTAHVIRRDGRDFRFGINDRQSGNRQFVLNIMHWLSRAL